VEQVESITSVMRALDYRYGGGACRDAVVAQVAWAQQLLGSRYAEEVRLRLHLALADLHNLAGWTSFDVGRWSPARRHFARALEQARAADDASLVANVLYRMGRLHLHRGMLKEALRLFQLGQIAAQDSGLTPQPHGAPVREGSPHDESESSATGQASVVGSSIGAG
jgi:tetratricopeptide (TPR) repeat protein